MSTTTEVTVRYKNSIAVPNSVWFLLERDPQNHHLKLLIEAKGSDEKTVRETLAHARRCLAQLLGDVSG